MCSGIVSSCEFNVLLGSLVFSLFMCDNPVLMELIVSGMTGSEITKFSVEQDL